MKIALAQINLTIGNIAENSEKILSLINQSIEKSVDLVIFPELTTVVKGAKDLLLIPEYQELADSILSQLLPFSEKISILIGGTQKVESDLFNVAYLLQNKKASVVSIANNLPYDETKYFTPKKLNEKFNCEEKSFLVSIGNDNIEFDSSVDFLIRLNSTPFIKNKFVEPIKGINNLYLNHVGLAQELIYDGGSYFSSGDGSIVSIVNNYEQQLLIIDTENFQPVQIVEKCNEERIFEALSFAFKEFCRVNNFKKAVLGLSGGIDSALTAVILCDAIGAENVLGITMPSKYSTEGSWQDSYDLADNLGMECRTISIKSLFDTFVDSVQGQSYCDLAEENLQARLRGNILMSFSNRENRVLVSTGNKSEASVGYCTLYGDTCGGINLISDLYKQEVYALSNWINNKREIIPQNTITKAPSAELRPNQKDQDSLPEYEVLDDILYRYIECGESVEQISKRHSNKLVKDIINKLNCMEFKRSQFTYCLKISKKSLTDRNYPIVNRFRY